MMAESLPEITSDKKRNTHFLQRMHECKRIFRIRAGIGPKHRNLKRERFWKPLEWVGLPVNVEQRDVFSSQHRRNLGHDVPSCRRSTQAHYQERGSQRSLQLRILKTFMIIPR